MKDLDQIDINILLNRSIFEEIHHLKTSFVSLFSEVANEISSKDLLEIHHGSQGLKISKGNELQHCPYQVLDIVRDFDKEQGFNIRILNWWGRGLFIFVYMGKNNEKITNNPDLFPQMLLHGFLMSKTSSPWDYKNMIDGGKLEAIGQASHIKTHLKQFSYLQLVKKIDYSEDYPSLKQTLIGQVLQILNLYRS